MTANVTTVNLKWIKCQGEVWCVLNQVDLDSPHFNNMDGVYVIWHGGPDAAVVYVGQGHVRDRLKEHRTNKEIQAFARLSLFVTWAAVQQGQRDGVERFLAEKLKPKVELKMPEALPTTVNLPW